MAERDLQDTKNSTSAKPRITLTLEEGCLQIWLNDLGRHQLIQELEGLSESSDHFHLGTEDDAEVRLAVQAYSPNQTVIDYCKVLYRPDHWDRVYYPHVLQE